MINTNYQRTTGSYWYASLRPQATWSNKLVYTIKTPKDGAHNRGSMIKIKCKISNWKFAEKFQYHEKFNNNKISWSYLLHSPVGDFIVTSKAGWRMTNLKLPLYSYYAQRFFLNLKIKYISTMFTHKIVLNKISTYSFFSGSYILTFIYLVRIFFNSLDFCFFAYISDSHERKHITNQKNKNMSV